MYVLIYDPSNPSYRRIPAFLAPRTWDHTKAPCYYVGNAQGGPSQSHDAIESVIEGKFDQYETTDLFGDKFDFSIFDKTACSNV